MSEARSVQARSVESVLEFYEELQIPAFAVFYKADPQFPYLGDDLEEGTELLTKWLQRLKREQSAAIYVIRLYKNPPASVNSKTHFDASLNFRLLDLGVPSNYLPPDMYKEVGGNYQALMTELGELRQWKKMRQQQDQEDEEAAEEEKEQATEATRQDQSIGKALFDELKPLIPEIGKRLVDVIVPPASVAPAKIAGAGLETGAISTSVGAAVNRLQRLITDPVKLSTLLDKLADMKEASPQEFDFYMGMLLKKKFGK